MMMVIDLVVAVLLAALGSLALQGGKSPALKYADKIGVAGIVAAIVVFISALIGIDDGLRLFVHLASVIVLVGLGAHYGFDFIAAKIKLKNEIYINEARSLVEKIETKKKILGITAAVLSIFMLVSALSA